MISVEEALSRIIAGLAERAPVAAEDILLSAGLGRVLAEDVRARVTQPPAAMSAMDGWAVRAADVARVPATLRRTGAVPAGSHFDGEVGPGDAVRIFTGAPVPRGADTIVIQEDADQDGDRVTVREGAPAGTYIRPAGLDFTVGASVGEHDLVRSGLAPDGLALDFWTIAMRPGKPLMFGRLGAVPLLGLPGNPVSSLVCALIFLKPALEALLGLEPTQEPRQTAVLATDLKANDRRQDYLRARLHVDEDQVRRVVPFPKQDSSMLSPLAQAYCLVIRPPHAPPAPAGTAVEIIPLGG